MAQKKRGISADKMFFDDIDDDDEEFDLDSIEMDDIADILDDDIDLDNLSVDDLDDMLGGDDLGIDDSDGSASPSGNAGGKRGGQGGSRGGRQQGGRDRLTESGPSWQDDLDDETLLEADLAAAEGRGGARRGGSGGQGSARGGSAGSSKGGSTGGRRRPGDGQGFGSGTGTGAGPSRSQAKGPSVADDPYGDSYGGGKGSTGGGYDDEGYEEETEQLVVPQWVVSINSKLNGNVSHAFLLEGNIRDYMVRNVSIKDGIIQTLDPYQDAFDVIASYDQAHGLTFDTFTMGDGTEVPPEEYKARFIELMREAQVALDMPVSDEIPRDPVIVFSIIGKIMEMPGETLIDDGGGEFYRAKMLLFVDYPEMLVPQVPGAPREAERQLAIIINDLCRSELVDQSGCCVIMMTDNTSGVSERIRSTSSRVDRVNVPVPLLEERRDFIHNVLAIDENVLSDGRKIFECEEGVTEDYLAINTAGLARFQIEDIVLRALADDVPITPELVKERKNEIITNDYDDVLEILEPKHGFAEVGGMQQLKNFFFEEVINPIHRGELESVPMGVLFMGPPGSGKTMLAKAIANESNMNCVNLNLNRILSKYVGGSEHNLDRALDCAMAMQPTIIFIDEIDEALPKRNGADQSGVSQRINKRLLEFFSDTYHRGQVMILAATNYPEKIDPAFKRAGRFDNRLPMFAPGKYDRARILHISAAKARYTISSFLNPDTLISNPFRSLKKWLEAGNTPNLENSIYDMTDFEFTAMNSLNRPVKMRTQIPKRLYRIIDRPKISLEEFYRSCDILFSGGEFPTRGGDEVGEEVLTDEQYRDVLVDFFGMNSDIFGKDARVYSFCTKWILYREVYYDQFGDLTVGKTGAELDVVINKCISLYRTFKAEQPERFKQMLERGEIKDERDIPWAIVLDACSKTTAAVSGIKSMEDYALIDTSDTDYIPDEEYGRLSSNKTISYRERQEQLLTRMKLLAGDNENKAELLKS